MTLFSLWHVMGGLPVAAIFPGHLIQHCWAISSCPTSGPPIDSLSVLLPCINATALLFVKTLRGLHHRLFRRNTLAHGHGEVGLDPRSFGYRA